MSNIIITEAIRKLELAAREIVELHSRIDCVKAAIASNGSSRTHRDLFEAFNNLSVWPRNTLTRIDEVLSLLRKGQEV